MRVFNSPLLVATLALSSFLAANSAEPRTPADMEAGTRLQIFLDRANFSPGKLDGRYGDFTRKALLLYKESLGEQSAAPSADTPSEIKPEGAPDVTGLDLATVNPVFTTYTVTEADLQSVGELPGGVPEQSKLKALPYASAAEAIAEKFHCDVDFLSELNEGKTKEIKVGDQLTVPNVEPFDLAAVKDLKPGGASPEPSDTKTDASEAKDAGEIKDEVKPQDTPTTSVKVDTKTNMVSLYESDKLVAAYPVTIGTGQTESPIGDWKVTGVAKMPDFRYDEQMLKHGERGDKAFLLPPGPNNPVGVVWIALNKKGIGLHGTSEPDSIGRSVSHGCIRLANWDIARLALKVKAGVPVAIH